MYLEDQLYLECQLVELTHGREWTLWKKLRKNMREVPSHLKLARVFSLRKM